MRRSTCFSNDIKAGFRQFIFGAPSEPHMNPYLTVSEVEKYCHEPMNISLGVLADECRTQIKETREQQDNLAQ